MAKASKIDKLTTELHKHIKDGNVAGVTKLLEENQSVAKEICTKEMPKVGSSLHAAACWGDVEIAKAIVDKSKMDVNIKHIEGDLGILYKVPLHEACAYGNTSVVTFLLAHKADPNLTDAGGLTPLHSACQGKSVAIVQKLLQAGANINAQDNKLETPLLASILRSPLPLTKCLIDSGCDITSLDNEGQSAFHYAVEWGNLDLIQILLQQGAKINLQDHNGQTPLHCCDDDDIREFLIKNGADPSIRDKRGRPPIEGVIDKDTDEIKELERCLQKHQLLAEKREIRCNAEVAEATQQKFNKLAIAGDSNVKETRGNVMAELLSKGKKVE